MTHNFHSGSASLPTIPLKTISPSASSSPTISISASASSSSAQWPTRYATLISATGYDPYGDEQENPELAKFAIDADPKTAWTTTNYFSNTLGKKPGVGLLIDLGKKTKVSQVEVDFVGAGHGATVFLGDSPKPDLANTAVLGTVSNSNKFEAFTPEKPVTGQYVLIWMTKVPRNVVGNYVGGITDVKVGL
jgi:hypothetical protein